MIDLLEVISSASTDADAQLLAHAYTYNRQKTLDDRMANERTILGALGMTTGEQFMLAIEAASIPSRVKTWFKPSEAGIDLSSAEAISIVSSMVPDVLSQPQADAVLALAYDTIKPYQTLTLCDIKRARGTLTKVAKSVAAAGYLKITTTAACEQHNPQAYAYIEALDYYKRVAGFRDVAVAGDYITEVPKGYSVLYVEDAYGVL